MFSYQFSFLKATAESGSEHPLSIAIRADCAAHFGEAVHMGRCHNFQASSGFGLSADVSNIDSSSRTYKVKIGNREFMKRNMLEVSEQIDEAMSEHETNGRTAVLVAIDGECAEMLY
jgi:Cu+-exporting ATPase